VDAVQRAGAYNKNDQCPPAAIMWPDKERQWEPLLPELRERLPMLTLEPYNSELRTGPASWLRCMIARTLPDDVLPADAVPVIYLPGVSRADIRAVEECPRPLQPLAELQYSGVLFAHRNGRDWTVAGFLQSAEGGLGIPLAGDAATKTALLRALVQLAHEPVARLKREAPLRAAFFDELLNPDPVRRLLLWLNDPAGYPSQLTSEQWHALCELCGGSYGFHPVDDGPLAAAGLLGGRQGKWAAAWDRFEESPEAYPNIPGVLDRARPSRRLGEEAAPYWPLDNDGAEADLREALSALQDAPATAARAALGGLESVHGRRRGWVWSRLGRAPLAAALEHLAALAGATEKTPGGASVADIAASYAGWGWKADAAVLDALAAVESAADVAAVKAALLPLYRPWLESAAAALQDAVLGNPAANYAATAPPPAVPGTCILFSDALRFDAGAKLAAGLEKRGLVCTVGWGLAALPPVTPTAKPAVSPATGRLTGGAEPGLAPVVKESGAALTAAGFRKLLEADGYQVLAGDDLGDPAGMAWTETGAIDAYGHRHGWKVAHHLAGELRALERRVDALLAHGWQQVVVVTDHGWLLLPGGLPKAELPEHLTVVRKGRCAVLKEGAATDQQTVTWHWDPGERVAVASGIACYEAGKEYEHGGISPQECVVPVLTVTRPVAQSAEEARIAGVTWKGMRCAVAVTGAADGASVDIRTKAGNAATSLCTPKQVENNAASLLVEDDDQLGAAAFVVLLNEARALQAQTQTTIGG
jgi:hypothetical protein